MIAGCDPGHYGQLQMFVTPQDNPVDGPSIVAARIDANPTVSQQITLLNSEGSAALLGNVLMIPVANALLYIQPLYVESARNAFPELQRVIAVYGNQVQIAPSLSAVLSLVFAAPVSTSPNVTNSTGGLTPQVRSLLNAAQQAYEQSQTDLKAGNLGAYQTDIQTLESNLQEVQQLTGGTVGAVTTPSSSTTTTTP
jgi:uncharacterized membrane protein (UPF0182 family)